MAILKILAYAFSTAWSARWYMRLADRMGIIDRPNHRSSHSKPVVRGGGILFPLSWIVYFLLNGMPFPWFTTGLVLISLVSLADDLKSLRPAVRFAFHIACLTLCFQELGLWNAYPVWVLVFFYIVGTGALNAVNFMDGINGMTGLYALSLLLPLMLSPLAVENVRWDIASYPCLPLSISLVAFGWYNFRRKALCFAGDVGSISIGFIMIFLLLAMMTGREGALGIQVVHDNGYFDWKFILCLGVYGVDTVITILHRLSIRENIFKAHRRHLYQHLANEKRIPHLLVASSYAAMQLAINIAVLTSAIPPLTFSLILGFLALAYVLLKFRLPSESGNGQTRDAGHQP